MQRIRLQVFRHILVLRNPSWSGVGNFAEAQAGARQIVSRAQDEVQEAPPAGGAVPTEASITHLYDARGIVDKWLGHPTFWGMISEDALAKGEASKEGPPGEGPIIRWQTRIVLEPGSDGFHPANRKVSAAVYVKELGLRRDAKARLLAMVGKRYNRSKDELTITSERYEHREENRKDVLRTLVELIKEAKRGVATQEKEEGVSTQT